QAAAYFARALRVAPDSATAASWLSDLLLNWDWWVGGPSRNVVRSAAFSPDGRRLVTTAEESMARVWEADTGKPVSALLQHQGIVGPAVFSPDGRRVVTASEDRTARVWEAGTGKPVGAPLKDRAPVGSAVFSPDGRHVVTFSDTARVWEGVTGKPTRPAIQ